MRVRRKNTQSELVIWVTSGLMMLGMLVLISALWKLQIKKHSTFETSFERQTIRRVRLPAIRGKIYDSKGVCLADSVPNYCIAIYTEEMRDPRSEVANTLEVIHQISERIGLKPKLSYRDICHHFKTEYPPPHSIEDCAKKDPDDECSCKTVLLTVWRGLNAEQLGKWHTIHKLLKERKTPGLPEYAEGTDIILNTAELAESRTSTAANTLELIYKISEEIDEPLQVRYRDIRDHVYARRPLPLMAWQHISDQTMARWADSCSGMAGTDIYCRAGRDYPEGEDFAHVVGFTLDAASAKADIDGERVDFNMGGIRGGKGLESRYNALLEGEPGSKLVQIDASGYRYQDLQVQLPQAGGDLMLTIDANIQKIAKEALTMHTDHDPFDGPVRGAVVILDPNNGDVLAMVSAPSFDPNKYMTDWLYAKEINSNKLAKAYDRAVYGSYAPGSTFKPIAALGTLRAYPEYANVTHDCPRYHMIGKRKMRCNSTHGNDLSIRQTLEQSCNVYMYKMVLECGYEPIYAMAQEFGLGRYVGLFPDLENPDDPAQSNLKYGNLPAVALNKTDSCNLAIGQGAIQVAPLQMAMVAATIANGGVLYRPRLIQKFRSSPEDVYRNNPPWAIRRLSIPMEALQIVRGGMHDVIMSGRESAKQVRVGDIVIAGKTGTAEYGLKAEGKKNTWMISYAPFDQPRYAIAMIVENGEFGGTTVAPRLHELYKNLFLYDGTLKEEDV